MVNESEAESSASDTVTAGSDTLGKVIAEQQLTVEASSSDNVSAEVDGLPKTSEIPKANGATDGAGQHSGDSAISSDKMALEGGLAHAAEPESNCASCSVGEGQEAEVNFDHLELQVENLYASMSADEEPLSTKEKGFLPPDHEDAKKWFYRDPQGQVQGEQITFISCIFLTKMNIIKQKRKDKNCKLKSDKKTKIE